MIQTLGPRQVETLLAGADVDIVDVREAREWATGHVPGARHLPLDELRADPTKALPRDKVLFVCAKGARSLQAAKIAERRGLTEIYSLEGGTKGWVQAGLALATPSVERRRRNTPAAVAIKSADESSDLELDAIIGTNLRELRARRSLSLDELAKLSGVSRAQLGQIELGKSVPSINVVWKLARALKVPFAALVATATPPSGTTVIRRSRKKQLVNSEGRFGSRALFPPSQRGNVEFYELWLAGHSREEAEAHQPGTRENLVVTAGTLNLGVGGETFRLGAGDAIAFAADVPHHYTNPGSDECWMHLVMTYVNQSA